LISAASESVTYVPPTRGLCKALEPLFFSSVLEFEFECEFENEFAIAGVSALIEINGDSSKGHRFWTFASGF
jgi:hypothetical protein